MFKIVQLKFQNLQLSFQNFTTPIAKFTTAQNFAWGGAAPPTLPSSGPWVSCSYQGRNRTVLGVNITYIGNLNHFRRFVHTFEITLYFFLGLNSNILTREDPQLCQADFFQTWLFRKTIFSNEMGYT